MTSFPNSPRLLKGGIVVDRRRVGRDPARDRAAVQPRHAQPHAAAEERRHRQSRSRRGAAAERTGGRDLQARSGDRRGRHARARRQQRRRGRHPAEPDRARSVDLADQRAAQRPEPAVAQRHAGDRADDGAADAVRLEQEPRRARPDHRVHDQRGSVRPGPESDPREGEPRPARAERRRPGLRHQGRQHLHGVPAQQGTARGALQGGSAQRSRHHRAFPDDEARGR